MALWGGERTAAGDTVSMAQRRFWHRYGIYVVTAQTLNARDARDLQQRIES